MKSKREGGLLKNTLPQTSLFSQVFQVRSELSAFDRRIHPASGIWVWLSFEGVFEVTNYVWTWGIVIATGDNSGSVPVPVFLKFPWRSNRSTRPTGPDREDRSISRVNKHFYFASQNCVIHFGFVAR
jgi:hypothetical protein